MTTTMLTPLDTYASAFESLDPAWPLHDVRSAAFERFNALGFPTVKDEAWRYTNPKPITDRIFALAPPASDRISADAIAAYTLVETPCHQLVFVNGRFAPSLSSVGDLPDGVIIEPLVATAVRDANGLRASLDRHTELDREAFTALNSAMIEDGAFVHLPRNARLEHPVHLVFLTESGDAAVMTHPRVLVVAEAFSEATIIETYAPDEGPEHFTNTVTEIVVGENATLDHYKIVRENERALHVSSLNVTQATNSNVTSHNYSFGGALVRNHVNAALDGEGIHSTFNGLVMGHGEQHVDNALRIDHLKPNCNSWEYYKTILDDRSRGVFSGRIYVAEDAQKTDAKQTSMNLLLSEDADVTAKPQLEIFADDVKCTHGATIGQIEESQLFYLQSRGIDPVTARSMLIFAFANETISEIKVPEVRQGMERLLMQRLPQGECLGGGM